MVVVPNHVWAMNLFADAARAAEESGGCLAVRSKGEIRDASGDKILYFRAGRGSDWMRFAGVRVQWLFLMDLDEEMSDHLEERLRASIASDLWLNGQQYTLTEGQIAADVARSMATFGG